MKKLLLILGLLPISFFISSQTVDNPFEKLGYTPLMATLTKGEFDEFHDQKDIVEIGSVLYNTRTKEVVGILDEGQTTLDVSSATIAMSIDPLCEKYYWISPYVYCANNPVRFIDPDGRDWIENKKTGDVEWRDKAKKDNVPTGYNYIGESYKGFSISQTYTNHTGVSQLSTSIYYKDSDGNKKEIGGWVQTVDTSAPKEGDSNPTIDPPKGTNDNFPYYDSKGDFKYYSERAEFKGNKQDAYLYDRPARVKSTGNFTWSAETSLIEKTKAGNIPVLTLKWGFNQNKETPVKVVTPSVFHQNAIKQIPKR